jgi:hypothetical protein
VGSANYRAFVSLLAGAAAMLAVEIALCVFIIVQFGLDQGAFAARVAAFYSGDGEGPTAAALRACDPAGPLMVNVTKLLSAPEGGGHAFLAPDPAVLGNPRRHRWRPGQEIDPRRQAHRDQHRANPPREHLAGAALCG